VRYFKEHWAYLTTPGIYPGLDALRFLAISLVILFHFRFVHWGWIGVDLFFVLSGFLIGGALIDQGRQDQLSFARFYGHRALRILPVYYFFIAACFFLQPHQPGTMWSSLAAAFTFMQSTGSYYFHWPVDSSYVPGGSWTLVIEETFYVLAPVLIWLVTRASKSLWVIFAIFLAIFLCGMPVRLAVTSGFAHDDANWHFSSFIQFHSRFDELAAGVAAAAFMRLAKDKYPRWLFGCAAVAGIFIFLAFMYDKPDLLARPQYMTRPTIWMPTLLAITFASTTLALYDFKPTAPYIVIGARLSYGLYLMHLLVMGLIAPRSDVGWLGILQNVTSHNARSVIVILGCIALTYFLSLLIEYPFIRLYRRPSRTKSVMANAEPPRLERQTA
jgi:peptidoglycan/LPS O-acetylase OafA/YrhL